MDHRELFKAIRKQLKKVPAYRAPSMRSNPVPTIHGRTIQTYVVGDAIAFEVRGDVYTGEPATVRKIRTKDEIESVVDWAVERAQELNDIEAERKGTEQ